MLRKKLVEYQQLPIISSEQIKKFSQDILYYDELLIDPHKFVHPGSKDVLQPWMNKNISQIFHTKSHSFNAKLMLLSLTIGRKSQNKGLGYKLFQEIKEQKLSITHEKVMASIDLSYGVLKQLSKLSTEQVQAFVTVPKYFTNSSQIMFTQSRWQQFLYQDRFWISTFIFTLVFISLSVLLYSCNAFLNSFIRIVLFLCGMITWTLIEYFFHRFMLHVPLISGKLINGHFIHHAFPNLRNKLALSICKNLSYQFIIFLVIVKVGRVQQFNALTYILGVHFLMIFYDIEHYYFHFGPDFQIPILSKLRKNHMKHHFRDPNRGFGVTTTFWDWAFGTRHIL